MQQMPGSFCAGNWGTCAADAGQHVGQAPGVREVAAPCQTSKGRGQHLDQASPVQGRCYLQQGPRVMQPMVPQSCSRAAICTRSSDILCCCNTSWCS